MPVIVPDRSNTLKLPKSYRSPVIIDHSGIPRYWAIIYFDVLRANLKDSTKARIANSIDNFYQYVSINSDKPAELDDSITNGKLHKIQEYLTGYLTQLNNKTAVDGIDRSRKWRNVNDFVLTILHHLASVRPEETAELQSSLSALKYLTESLRGPRPQRRKPIRALNSSIVEELYDIFTPGALNNPFRTQQTQFRNFLVFYLLLHLGLRKSELLFLTIADICTGLDSESGNYRYWIKVSGNQFQDIDPRSDLPDLKNHSSDRQLPISEKMFNLVNSYIEESRGKASHPYLFTSQKGGPLSKQATDDLFASATRNLSSSTRKLLISQGLGKVKPHSLRHTSVVHRLTVYYQSGIDQDHAFQKVRRFYGWAPGSKMPLLYGEAYFESRLKDVWQGDIESFVETLKTVEI